MLRFILVVCLTAFVTTSQVFAEQMEDVVHLKNGSIVRGTIIEQIPGESLKIQTQGGSVFVYTMDEIAKISREPVGMGGHIGAEKDTPAPEVETGTLSSQTAEPIPATAVCLIGDHSGFPEADARTAALLVCDELRKQGIPIGEPVYEAPASASIYRVALHRLGQKVLARLNQENPVGTVIIERQILLATIEEMVSSAPRLVDALVHRKSLASTVDMENLVEQEARVHRKIPGESFWDIGILGTFALITDADMIAKPGYKLGWFHEIPSYAVGTEFWVTGGEDHEGDSFYFVSLGIGGRYFFNEKNVSPYVGGGLAIVWAGYSEGYIEDEGDSSGLGAYAVGGIEVLRLSRARLRLELRVDRPFFRLPSRDMVPITLGISFSR